MSTGMSVSVAQLAAAVAGNVIPARDQSEADALARIISGVGSLGDAKSGDLSFLANLKYAGMLATTMAGAVLVREARPALPLSVQIVVANPDFALAQLVAAFGPQPAVPELGIHPTAMIGNHVRIGARTRIGAFVVIGDNCVIGDDCVLYAHVVLGAETSLGSSCILYPQVSVRERCVLGDRVLLHNGAVIGSDGFGFATIDGIHRKIPQVGIVVIEDDVEIGANSTVDRARFGRTRIGAGSKIDNLVQIAHNVEIGPHAILAAQVGIAGSTKLGHHVTLAGQAGVAGHLVIGDQATATGKAGVTKNLPNGTVARGLPAQEYKAQIAQEIAVRKLPETAERVRMLERRVMELERLLMQTNGKGRA
ncbi:MAG: UDP-3-O-(3-hydroxymyristoyl)glucosamine N-acyltransferase [Planctomycetota bacterium]